MTKDELKEVIISQGEIEPTFRYVKREVEEQIHDLVDNSFVILISGVRRCGKSTLMHQIRKRVSVSENYLNFDDNRLVGFCLSDFEILLECFYEMFGNQNIYYFDEIQNIEGWEFFVRRLHNEGKKVFITGSNSKLLSKEMGTHLTGRSIQIELFPFSFREFISFKEIEIKEGDYYRIEKFSKLKALWDEYIHKGGFPTFLQTSQSPVFKNLCENIIYKDIIARYKLKGVKSINELFTYLISNVAKDFSYNKLKNLFNVKNVLTIKDYILYFEQSYIFFTVNKFDYSYKKQIANSKKIYSIDTGLTNHLSFRFSENYGRQLENAVFLQLKRMGFDIYYHRGKYECDFVVRQKDRITKAIQVCKAIGRQPTKDREVRGLLEAVRTYGLPYGLLLTQDTQDEFEQEGVKVVVKPIWSWMLTQK